jgi:hypothetical protein
MREKITAGVNTISELSVEKHPDTSRKWLIDYRYSNNLTYFSLNLLDWLSRALQNRYNGELSDIKDSSAQVLRLN